MIILHFLYSFDDSNQTATRYTAELNQFSEEVDR